ncbi:MAG: NADP-dependent oxidoreductase, partial [Acidimicrobiales bacterium]
MTGATSNHRLLLRRRPEGLVRPEDFEADEVPVPRPGDDEAVMQVEWLGIDATVRTWLNRGE